MDGKMDGLRICIINNSDIKSNTQRELKRKEIKDEYVC